MFDMEFIPSIIDDTVSTLKAPKGFEREEIDALFLRNSEQYLYIIFLLGFLYIVLRFAKFVIFRSK